ncbi:MAG: hypothetical protein FWG65_08150 [Turicibacter sp.]|nr:hypothetical protein [Turicibacter sp.]
MNLAEKRSEKIFDALVKVALEEVIEEELSALPTDEELKAYTPSPALELRINQIIARRSMQRRRKRAIGIAARVSLYAAAFALVFFTALMSVEESRIRFLNTITGSNDHVAVGTADFVPFDEGMAMRGMPLDLGEFDLVMQMPGFNHLSTEYFEDDVSVSIYQNDNGETLLVTVRPNASIADFIENADFAFSLRNVEGYDLVINTDSTVIAFERGDSVYEFDMQEIELEFLLDTIRLFLLN